MDIAQWIQETNEATRLPDEELTTERRLRPPREGHAELGYRHRRNKKRAGSDSSIIEHALMHHRPDQTRVFHGRSSASHDGRKESPKIFEKRARHKTRPDRYELKSAKRKKPSDARSDIESKPRHRKLQSRGDGERSTRLLDSFQLKNRPRNNRLTLKPGIAHGLFSHGRASTQLSGRGAGLPDLVFNEMKFLQKPKEHQDQQYQRSVERQQHPKKTRKQELEEEISTYFLARKPTGTVPGPKRSELPFHSQQRSQPRDEISEQRQGSRNPSIASSGNPSLKFSSRYPRQEERPQDCSRESPYTCSSTSPGQPKLAAKEDPIVKPRDRESVARKRGKDFRLGNRKSSSLPRRTHICHDINSQDGVHLRESRSWFKANAAKEPSPLCVYKSAENIHNHMQRDTFLKSTPLPRRSTPICPTPGYEKLDSWSSPLLRESYRTSDILDLRQCDSPGLPDMPHTEKDPSAYAAFDKENIEPKSLNSTSQLLEDKRETFKQPASVLRTPSLTARYIIQNSVDNSTFNHFRTYDDRSRQRQQHTTELSCSHPWESKFDGDDCWTAPGPNRISTKRPTRDEPALSHPKSTYVTLWQPEATSATLPIRKYTNEEHSLEGFPGMLPIGVIDRYDPLKERQFDEPVHADQAPDPYEAQPQPIQDHIAPQSLVTGPSYYSWSTEPQSRNVHSRHERPSVVAGTCSRSGNDHNDEFAGLWKPNKLY